MADVNTEGHDEGKKGKQKKMSTRVDFTPMCDLGFLLITFFMLTTSMLKPQTITLIMPTKDKVSEEEANVVKESNAITLILESDNKIFYYFGKPDTDNPPEVIESDFSPEGIRDILLKRNANVVQKITQLKSDKAAKKISDEEFERLAVQARADKASPVVMIKPSDRSSYKNLVDILDEMHICNIGGYAIIEISPYDTTVVYRKQHPNL
ncbi:MAG: biopolymer transporter ExbD [Bacteroidales bacterium]|jgi:biopolymer transport protein ExbD|nr:biopolymer transporter ExbD [Bacteroidales bacterium]